MKRKKTLHQINSEAIKIVRKIKILEKISWPNEVEKEFFYNLARGKKLKIKFQYPTYDLSESKIKLTKLLNSMESLESNSHNNPLEKFTALTIESYCKSIDMIHAIGSKSFQELSILEYGHPKHLLFASQYSHLETAKKFIESLSDYEHPYLTDNVNSITSKMLQKKLSKEAKKTFNQYAPKITISETLISRAAAGKKSIRIRQNELFSTYDQDQLLVHELMTHTLTAINGSLQTQLPLLEVGAPRTTKTQEGLATFSEIITGSLDLTRLKRICLRVIALEMALEGADFYDLYEYFYKHNGQNCKESYLSASRLLRGGFSQGGICFTKDGVYLEGLIRVHSFFRWAFKTGHLDYTHLLFCGRLDINDIFLLKPCLDRGEIQHPQFLPTWYKNIDLFAGKLAFSLILNGIDLDSVEKHYFNKRDKTAA